MLDIAIILLLILLNGVLAMSEAALVAARTPRLAEQASNGVRGAKAALRAARSPVEFLSTVQVGITLIGIVSGVFGGAVLADDVAEWLRAIGPLEPYAEPAAMVMVVLVITYFSLVVGELAPKRFALEHPEALARATAPSIALLSKATSPAVRLLSISTAVLLKPLGIGPGTNESVSDEEIRAAIKLGAATGVLEQQERDVIERVFTLADRRAVSFMVPRADVECIEPDASPDRVAAFARHHQATHFPVSPAGLDDLVGVVSLIDLAHAADRTPDALMRAPLFIPETTKALAAIEMLRTADAQLAFVTDEHGTIEGMVRLVDLIGDIVGEPVSADEPEIAARRDGSFLLDGLLPVDEWIEHVRADASAFELSAYQTIGGMVIHHLGRIARVTDSITVGGWIFEVVDTDGRRVDKVLARLDDEHADR